MPRPLLIVIALVVAACSANDATAETTVPETTTTAPPETTTTAPPPPPFGVTSPAFDDGDEIPAAHTCDGADVSPQLDIVGLPVETQSIVIIVDDPDAPLGTWDHWVEYDIPAESGSLRLDRGTEAVGVPGVNSWNVEGYMGPCPPPGEEHTYHFVVYALDGVLDLPPGVGSEDVRTAMESMVLDDVELTGTYAR